MSKELIIIKQLPQIEEHLKELSADIDIKVENAKSLVCTEENVKTIKKVRADLNNEFKEVEKQRKDVKEKVLAPYMQFEEIYKQYISDKYKAADKDLKNKIDITENELKAKKEEELKFYFNEYIQANNIDFVEYNQLHINVTLSASMKSLKTQIKEFIDKVVNDLKLIETQEYKEEIIVDYKRTLNVSDCILKTQTRHKLMEEEKRKQEELKAQKEKMEEMQKQKQQEILKIANEPLEIPIEEKKEEPILKLKFTVKATKTKLKELKKFLDEGEYDYE